MIFANKNARAAPSPPAGPTRWLTWLAAWARGPTLARDIAIVLAVKLILLIALKYAFFNHPQAEHMSLPPAVVAAQLLSVPVTAPSHGDHHDQ